MKRTEQRRIRREARMMRREARRAELEDRWRREHERMADEEKVLRQVEIDTVREFNKTTRRKREVRRELKARTKLIKQHYAEEHHDMRKMSTKEATKIALQQLRTNFPAVR